MAKGFLALILLIIYFPLEINCKFKRVCYLRVDTDDVINVSIINGSLCTHIILGFASIVNGTIAPSNEKHLIRYKNVMQLKNNYTDLKIMLSVGGGGNDQGFHQICSNQDNIDRFVSSVLNMTSAYNFDGLDIDWEFPTWNTEYPEDKHNFTQLLKGLSSSFSRKLNGTENSRQLLLSVAVAAQENIVHMAYNVSEMAKYVDFINIMTYDFHTYSEWLPYTGFNAPLYGKEKEASYFRKLNVNYSVNYWEELGMSKNKIMVGIPTYGRAFKLNSNEHTGPYSKALAQKGDMTYTQVCQMMTNSSTHYRFDDESKVPYIYNGNLWVSYDDIESVTYKAEWIRDNHYAGSMTFDLNADDYQYKCDNRTRFVLQSIIHSILN